MHESQVAGLARLHQGKVRDIYAIDEQHMLIVTTDRLSAFDVVLPDPIPGKGRVLTQISNHWFGRTGHIVPNHLSDFPLSRAVPDPAARALLADRSMIVRRLNALPVEAVVRGYLIGSGWKDYLRTGAVSGVRLPAGLRESDRLPEPIFTPSTKADVGHDENIDFETMAGLIGRPMAERVRDLYRLLDRELASLLERVDDDDLVILMSDHGHQPVTRSLSMNKILEYEGFLRFGAGSKVVNLLSWGRVRAVARVLYDKLGLHGRVAVPTPPLDWGRTRAYTSVVSTGEGVSVNLVGREPHGLCIYPQPGRYSLGHTGVFR